MIDNYLGSARVVLDSAGTVKDKQWYYAFGSERSSTVNTGQKYLYTGKPFDDDDGVDLYYYGARYYDAALGRFTSVDPLARKYPGWSPYVYTLDNPLKYVDPDGRFVETAVDVLSVGLSVYDMWQEPSWENAGYLALDVGCALVPFVPAVGAIRHAGKIDDALKAMKRGLRNEEKVLQAEGLTSNRKMISARDPKTRKLGKTMPDAVRSDGQTVEVKDRKYLSDSPQLRRQSEISKRSGKQAEVITGQNTKVSGSVSERMSIQRKSDLGPKDIE